MNPPKRNSSKQRAAVLTAVRAFAGHPSAEQVHRAVRRKLPRISLATVYRNLNVLVDDGVIAAVEQAVGGTTVFDKMTAPHHHFTCTECGAMFDVDLIPVAQLVRDAKHKIHGTVEIVRVDFLGTCTECTKHISKHMRPA